MDREGTYKFLDKKVILKIKDRVCDSSDELLTSKLFKELVERYIIHLKRKTSPLLKLFDKEFDEIADADVKILLEILKFLEKMPIEFIPKLVNDSNRFVIDPMLLSLFIENLYNYWRGFERFIICDSFGDNLDKRPYRTFNSTIESLTHLVRKIYRDIQENITGKHPNVYRQLRAGAEIAVIALPKTALLPDGAYQKLSGIPFIRQILLYPPLLLNPPMNKRSGKFERIYHNPLEFVQLNVNQWLCYPAKVGSLLILVYFNEKFFELGLSLCNLFDLADDEFLTRPVDAVFLFGISDNTLDNLSSVQTIFYDDLDNHILTGAIPNNNEFGYFGYLKKMILTLHNIKMMKKGLLPFHGALVSIILKGHKAVTILIIGDTGAGKSETIEAFRIIGEELIEEIIIIADDMGSLEINGQGAMFGYGTEIGAFVRLDDLQPGYAFGQLDRTIIMNPSQTNARVILPVTSYDHVIKGYPIDIVVYANNYEEIDDDHPIVERLKSPESALHIFREGTAMSKGTTTAIGLVHTYFVNVFGAVQYKSLHEEIAIKYFDALFKNNIFVGQLRTRLGVSGWERKGPEEAANELLKLIGST
jgi:hypothetical protein